MTGRPGRAASRARSARGQGGTGARSGGGGGGGGQAEEHRRPAEHLGHGPAGQEVLVGLVPRPLPLPPAPRQRTEGRFGHGPPRPLGHAVVRTRRPEAADRRPDEGPLAVLGCHPVADEAEPAERALDAPAFTGRLRRQNGVVGLLVMTDHGGVEDRDPPHGLADDGERLLRILGPGLREALGDLTHRRDGPLQCALLGGQVGLVGSVPGCPAASGTEPGVLPPRHEGRAALCATPRIRHLTMVRVTPLPEGHWVLPYGKFLPLQRFGSPGVHAGLVSAASPPLSAAPGAGTICEVRAHLRGLLASGPTTRPPASTRPDAALAGPTAPAERSGSLAGDALSIRRQSSLNRLFLTFPPSAIRRCRLTGPGRPKPVRRTRA